VREEGEKSSSCWWGTRLIRLVVVIVVVCEYVGGGGWRYLGVVSNKSLLFLPSLGLSPS